MKTVVIDVLKNDVYVADVEDTVETWHHLLDCDFFDIVTRKIDGQDYDIVCDDEALLKGSPIVSAVDEKGAPMLCGSIAVVNVAKAGELVGLSSQDVKKIRNQVLGYLDIRAAAACDMVRPVLVCEY